MARTHTFIAPIDSYLTCGLTGGVHQNQAGSFIYSVQAGQTASGFPVALVAAFWTKSTSTCVEARAAYFATGFGHDPTYASIVRLEDYGTYPPDAIFEIACTTDAGPTYFIDFTPLAGTAFSGQEDKTGTAKGWLAVHFQGSGIGSGTRYIQLYE